MATTCHKRVDEFPDPDGALRLWFDHGLGDCVHFIAMLQPYLRRGLKIKVHFEDNKRWLWESMGIAWTELNCSRYHPFAYHADFNLPTAVEGTGNKIASNFCAPLPDIGTPEDLWREVCLQDLSDRLRRHVSQEARLLAEQIVAGMPTRPVVLLHTHGTNLPEAKNLPEATCRELYDRLLPWANVICLDWNNRVPLIRDGRIRYTMRDFGHLSIEELVALYHISDLMIGVDSGPFHLTAFTPIPALGVFHHHYPGCVTLPQAKAAVMTRDAPSYQVCNRPRRKLWSILEYPGSMPSAEAIATHAHRMLYGPRFCRDLGRNTMLLHWIRDWQRSATSLSGTADRSQTFEEFLRLGCNFPFVRVVETGCQRSLEDWSAGASTTLFGAWLDGRNEGTLDSVDIAPENIATAKAIVDAQGFGGPISFHVSDSVAYLRARPVPVDLLYLDSMDADLPGHEEHCLAEFQAAEHLLHASSIVLIDDTVYDHGWRGKGALAVPYALSVGWRIRLSGYQTLLTRDDT